ncbi:(Fe-S)-binding protein [Dongia deserti]|uniref:(Fe-S)-binding protein n=1 Tax=Dongia deserti TaxID=2268030 RepID=UPI000E659388|nr:(Fe-S)-binding protein [Dongia deserti]
MNGTPRKQVGLFVTCLVDLYRPVVGFAAIALIERSGPFTVVVPDAQTCCGQPGYNSGDKESALAIARQVVQAFEGFDHVVVPSGSCAGMIKTHYPELLAGDPAFAARAKALADKTYELTQFLRDVAQWDGVYSEFAQTVTYHDSCSSLRELQVKKQPRELLAKVGGLKFKELPDSEPCCGFGGTFCVKFPDISNRMVEDKVANIEATGADVVLAADMGCLLNIAGKLKRKGSKIEARHVAEVLAGMAQDSAIGEGQ